MSGYVFKLPDIGEGIAEAEIVHWHVAVGDEISEDAPLVDMMTDKATVEIESPVSGTIVELVGGPGDRVAIGAPLVVIATGDDRAEESEAERQSSSLVESSESQLAASRLQAEPVPDIERVAGRHGEAARGAGRTGARVLASPAVRARARDLEVDLRSVPAGDGIVRHSDLDTWLMEKRGKSSGVRLPPQGHADDTFDVIGLRRRIAEKMTLAKRHIPHFTYVEEFDVTALEKLRAELNEFAGDRGKLTLLPFLIAGICAVLPEYPMLNACYDDSAGKVTRYRDVHMGIATQTEAGLMVPVIRSARSLGLWQLSHEIARLADAARSGRVSPDELTGSTLTITSLGRLGGIATTPVINRPEVAIVGPNRIIERPTYITDETGIEVIEKRLVMNVSISCDHRVVDGWDAANFMQALKRVMEQPTILLAL